MPVPDFFMLGSLVCMESALQCDRSSSGRSACMSMEAEYTGPGTRHCPLVQVLKLVTSQAGEVRAGTRCLATLPYPIQL